MNQLLRACRRINFAVSDILNLHSFSQEFKIFTGSYALFSIGNTLSNIFVGTFLFKINGDFKTIAMYYLVYYACEMLFIYIALKFAHKISSVRYIIIGFTLHAAGYMLLLLLREKTVYFYPLIAIVISSGGGFYFTSHYNCFQLYSTDENRHSAIAQHGLFGNMIALTVPPLSGIILINVPGILGYMIIFGISLSFFLAAIFNIRRLKDSKKSDQKLSLIPFLRESAPLKALNYVILGQFVIGLRQGIYGYYFNILIFSMTTNEFVLGIKNMLAGIAAIITYYALGRIHLSRKGRLYLMFFGAFLSLFLTSGILVWTTATAVIVYCVLDGIAQIFFGMPTEHINYDTAVLTATKRDMRAENTATRLISLESGRIVGISLSFLIPTDIHTVIIFFVALSAVNIIACLFYRNASKACQKHFEKREQFSVCRNTTEVL